MNKDASQLSELDDKMFMVTKIKNVNKTFEQ